MFLASTALLLLTSASILALLYNPWIFFLTTTPVFVLISACAFLFLDVLIIIFWTSLAFLGLIFTFILAFSVSLLVLAFLTFAFHVQCLPIF